MFKLNKSLFQLGSCVVLSSVLVNNIFADTQEKKIRQDSMPIKIHLRDGTDKYVQVIKMKLGNASKKQLSSNIALMLKQPYRRLMQEDSEPTHVDIGMNLLPVLDQGVWGTCATFATTAAIDALFALAGEETISQLCNLEFGRTLNNPDEDGGWSGSFGKNILQQISDYGYINKAYQHTAPQGCGGLNHYPAYDPENNGSPMPAEDFATNSIKTFKSDNWHPLLAYNGEFSPIDPKEGERLLTEVKHAILKGNRVVFGTLLDPFSGDAGAVGSFDDVQNDAWVLTPQIQRDITAGFAGGHEMVIEGYDDNACAEYVDIQDGAKKLQKQCGILHLRNSWSSYAGDKGDYYVTYDYFKTMTLEAYELMKTTSSLDQRSGLQKG